MTATPFTRTRADDGPDARSVTVGTAASGPSEPSGGYRHEALLFRGSDGFLTAVGPFLQEGIDNGETVILALPPERLALLRDAFPEVQQVPSGPDRSVVADGSALTWALTGAAAGRLVPSWQRFAQHWDGRPVRGVTEPMWCTRRQAEREECLLAEAMLNLAVPATVPLWLACGYDVDAVPGDVLDETFRSHSLVLDTSTSTGTTTYTGAHHVAAVFERALATPVEPVRRLVVRPGNGAEVGDWVRRWATGWGLGHVRAGRLAGALRQLGQACLAEGGVDAAVLLLWQDGHALVGQLTAADPRDADGGRTTPLAPHELLAPDSPLGSAVARADDCCDLVQVRSNPDGTVVRVSSWL